MYGTVLRIGDLIRKMEMIGPKPLLVRGRHEVRPHVFPRSLVSAHLFNGLCSTCLVSGGHASKPTGSFQGSAICPWNVTCLL